MVTANGQFYTGAVAGDFVIISQTGSTIWGNSGGERMRLNTNGTVSIGNTNNTFKLDVTGTGRFTGQLTLGSTITNGTYTYTLPSATGTLALTSDLSSYVPTTRTVSTTSPLSGGGALSSDLTLSISQASGSANGYLSSTDWTTFNSKQGALTLTTTGSSGASTLIGNTLNVPTYTLSGLGGVPTSRTLTINGTAYDLSADRSWTISAGISGSGTTNYVPKFTSGTAIGNSLIFDNGTNVGIGTAAPNAALDVLSIIRATNNATTGLNTSNIQLAAHNGTSVVVSGSMFQTNSTFAYQQISGNQTNIYGTAANGMRLATANAPIVFSTGNSDADFSTERMRITSTGNVGIGTTAPSEKLTVNGGAIKNIVSTNTSSHLQVVNSSGSTYFGNDAIGGYLYTDWNSPFVFYTNNAERMRLTSTGELCINATATSGSAKLYVNGGTVFGSVQVGSLGTGTVYSSSGTLTNTNPSDKRLKENITPITYGLNEILQLNPVSFDWKNDNNKNKQFGFIAQEVQQVMPEAVIDGEYLGLEKDAIYTALINAIKELKAEIEQLKNK